jgi:DUF2934 family protein
MEQSLHHHIRERAYKMWDASGRMDGQADQYWLAAEREVLAEMTGHASAPKLVASGSSQRRTRDRADVRPQRKKTAKAS